MKTAETIDRIVKEITINAPAQRVFSALADPQQRVKWWGAQGRFQVTHMESDLRPGGAFEMRGDAFGGKPFVIKGEYRAVEPPHVLEFTWLPDFHPGAPVTVVRFDLQESGGATTVRLTHSGFTNEQSKEAYQGWPWLLSMLQKYSESQS
jgi:uncharacterized protein YndB with AHSA1/START domain